MHGPLKRLSLSDPGIPVGSLLGTPLRVQPVAMLTGAGFIGAFAGQFAGWMPESAPRSAHFMMGLGGYLGMVASLLAHEFGHVLVARRFGTGCAGIALTPFGMVADVGAFRRPVAEGCVALAGPAVSLALALLAWLAWAHLDGLAALQARSLAFLNILIAAFNLIPNYPMDGGRVVRAVAWGWTGDIARATRIAARVGWGGAALIAALGAFQVINGNPFGLLTAMLAVVMMSYTAREVRERHAEAPLPASARTLMSGFGLRAGEPGVTLCPLHLSGCVGPAVVFWDGERKVGHAPASAIVRVGPDASPAEMQAAVAGGPEGGWPILLVCDGKPLGYVPVGRIMALPA